MRITRSASTAAIMLAVVARVISAQTAAAAPATHHAPSVETMYKQMGLVAHAAKGQTVDQQKIDAHECFNVAKGQTGFDPLSAASVDPAAAAAAAEKQAAAATQGQAVVGAAKGTAAGD